jgi:hypothetical protein
MRFNWLHIEGKDFGYWFMFLIQFGKHLQIMTFTCATRVVEVARKNIEVLNNHKYMEIFSRTTKYGG